MYFKIASILALVAASVDSSPTSTFTTREQSINPPASVIHARHVQPISQLLARSLTNGRRLALGLPLNPPKPKRSSWQHHSASASWPLPSASGSPTTTGYIQMVDSKGGDVLGYVAKQLNAYGEYGNVTKDEDDALKVKFNLGTATKRNVDLETINGPDAGYCFFGAINGYASTSNDIGKGSPNYQYIGATKQTPPYSPPTSPGNSFTAATKIPKTSESAIFEFKPRTQEIIPRYVNTDRSKPETYVGINKDEVLILTGDKSAFTSAFGEATWITLKFVSA